MKAQLEQTAKSTKVHKKKQKEKKRNNHKHQ